MRRLERVARKHFKISVPQNAFCRDGWREMLSHDAKKLAVSCAPADAVEALVLPNFFMLLHHGPHGPQNSSSCPVDRFIQPPYIPCSNNRSLRESTYSEKTPATTATASDSLLWFNYTL